MSKNPQDPHHQAKTLQTSFYGRTDPRARPATPCRDAAGNGGARRDRTDDLMLAKHALSQLSYGPSWPPPSATRPRGIASQKVAPDLVGLGRLELPTSRLSSARSNQLSYKPELETWRQTSARHAWRPESRPYEEREAKTTKSRKWGLKPRYVPRDPRQASRLEARPIRDLP